MKKIFENAIWWSGVVMVGLILGVSIQFVKAWTEPAAAPPGGNVGAPLNTGPLYQIKSGILGVVGLVTNSFRMTTGAGAGKVLTSDAAGNATWGAGGGSDYSFTYLCYSKGWSDSTPQCQDVGGTQKNCPSGYTQEEYLGDWGLCAAYGAGWGTLFFMRVPGGHCGTGFGGATADTYKVGYGYICSKD